MPKSLGRAHTTLLLADPRRHEIVVDSEVFDLLPVPCRDKEICSVGWKLPGWPNSAAIGQRKGCRHDAVQSDKLVGSKDRHTVALRSMPVMEGDNVVAASPVDVEGIPRLTGTQPMQSLKHPSPDGIRSGSWLRLLVRVPRHPNREARAKREGGPDSPAEPSRSRIREPFAVPTDDRLWFDDSQCRAPVPPDSGEKHPPNKPDGWGQARSFVGVLNDTDLVSAGEDLQLHGGTGSVHASESSAQWPNERHLLAIGEAGSRAQPFRFQTGC